jgi:hypothetical protein
MVLPSLITGGIYIIAPARLAIDCMKNIRITKTKRAMSFENFFAKVKF